MGHKKLQEWSSISTYKFMHDYFLAMTLFVKRCRSLLDWSTIDINTSHRWDAPQQNINGNGGDDSVSSKAHDDVNSSADNSTWRP